MTKLPTPKKLIYAPKHIASKMMKGSPHSACLDVFADIPEAIEIKPGKSPVKVPTGLYIDQKGSRDSSWYLQVLSRSGLACEGVVALGGVVDIDYAGEIHVILVAVGGFGKRIESGMRIAQIRWMFGACPDCESMNVGKDRADGGFGSTGA